jgi:hypothetical protein
MENGFVGVKQNINNSVPNLVDSLFDARGKSEFSHK